MDVVAKIVLAISMKKQHPETKPYGKFEPSSKHMLKIVGTSIFKQPTKNILKKTSKHDMCHGMLSKNTDYLWFIVLNTWDNQWPPVTPNNGREVLRNGTGHGHQSSRSHQSVTSNIAWNTSPFEAMKWANDTKMGRQLKHIFDSPTQDFPSIIGYRTPYFLFLFYLVNKLGKWKSDATCPARKDEPLFIEKPVLLSSSP